MLSSLSLILSLVVTSAVAAPAVQRHDVAVPGYSSNYTYPSHVDFYPYGQSSLSSLGQKVVYLDVNADAVYFGLPSDQPCAEWCLTGLTFSVDENGDAKASIAYFEAFRNSYTQYGETLTQNGYPFSFVYSYYNGVYFVYSYGWNGNFANGSNYTISSPTYSVSSSSQNKGRMRSYRSLNTTNAGPYSLSFSLDSDTFGYFDSLAAYYASVAVNSNDYAAGASAGYDAGYGDGYRIGYSEGYNDHEIPNQYTTITAIFGAVVDVPLKVLRGLVPFVIWDTPIIYIITTFLTIAVALVVIKRFF